MQPMRFQLLLAGLLSSCTVVPAPTTTAQSVAHPELLGTWTSRGAWSSDTLVQHLSLFEDGHYLRAATDSSPTNPTRAVLLEEGLWSFAASDTGKLVLAPSSRLTFPATATALSPAVLTADTAAWSADEDSLRLNIRRWWARDTFENLSWHHG